MISPGDKLVIGRYCGPNIAVGTSLNAKVLRNNGQQVHRSTYRALTPDELLNPDEIKACDEFDTATREKLGFAASSIYFEIDLDIVTSTIERYEDDEEHRTHMPKVDDITPEAMDKYIGT